MDFKIKILCHKCNCCFELRPELFNCSELICPNCLSKVSEEYASHIINGIKELSLVPESYSNEEPQNFFSRSGFSFKILTNSALDVPKL